MVAFWSKWSRAELWKCMPSMTYVINNNAYVLEASCLTLENEKLWQVRVITWWPKIQLDPFLFCDVFKSEFLSLQTSHHICVFLVMWTCLPSMYPSSLLISKPGLGLVFQSVLRTLADLTQEDVWTTDKHLLMFLSVCIRQMKATPWLQNI